MVIKWGGGPAWGREMCLLYVSVRVLCVGHNSLVKALTPPGEKDFVFLPIPYSGS